MAGHERVRAVVAAVLLLSGCAATRGRSGAPEQSGFLGDYSGLARNPAYPAAFVYVKPGVQWARYSTIQLDSARLYLADSTSKVSPEDQERLTGMRYDTLRDELDKYFVLVSGPGPEAIRLRVALTQVEGAKVAARVWRPTRPAPSALPPERWRCRTPSRATGWRRWSMSARTKALFAERAYSRDVQAAVNYWSKRMVWQLAR